MQPRCLLAPLFILAAPAFAQSTPAPPPPLPAEWPVAKALALIAAPAPTAEQRAATTQLVRDLASDDFSTRKRATAQLQAQGPDAFPGLREAVAASSDLELHQRTDALLTAAAIHLPAGVPPRTRAAIEGYLQKRVAALAPAIEGLPVVNRSIEFASAADPTDFQIALYFRLLELQETDPNLQKQRANTQRSRQEARFAIAQGHVEEAEELLRKHASAAAEVDDYVALRSLRLGMPLDAERALAGIASDDPRRERMKMQFLRAAGDFNHATDVALTLPEDRALPVNRQIMIEAGRYQHLAYYVDTSINRADTDYANVTCFLVLNQPERARKVLDDAIDLYRDTGLKGHLTRELADADRLEEAIAEATKEGQTADAFQFLCEQLRIREALALLPDSTPGSPDALLHLDELKLFGASQKLLARMAPIDRDGVLLSDVQAVAYFDYATAFGNARQPAEAAKWRQRGFDGLASVLQPIDPLRKKLDDDQRRFAQMNPADGDAIQQYQQLSAAIGKERVEVARMRRLNQMTSFYEIDPFDPEALAEARCWYGDLLDAAFPEPAARTRLTVQILSNAIPPEDAPRIVAGICDAMCAAAAAAPIDLRALTYVKDRFHAAHHDEWFTDLVQRCMERTHDATFLIPLGDLALENNDPARAAEYYQQAAVFNLMSPSLMYKLGVALAKSPATADDGKKLIAYAPFLVLADGDLAYALAKDMQRFEGPAVADAWLADYVPRITSSPTLLGTALARARNTAEAAGDFSAALELQKKILFVPDTSSRRYGADITLAQIRAFAHYHRLRALVAASKNDLPTLVDALNKNLDDGPPDIELLEKTLPILLAGDADTLAAGKKILARAIDRLQPLVEDYPADSALYQTQLTRLRTLH